MYVCLHVCSDMYITVPVHVVLGMEEGRCESIDSAVFLHSSLPDTLKHGLLLNIVLTIVVSLGRLASQLAPRIISLCLLFSGMSGGLSHPPGSYMGAGDPCTHMTGAFLVIILAFIYSA